MRVLFTFVMALYQMHHPTVTINTSYSILNLQKCLSQFFKLGLQFIIAYNVKEPNIQIDYHVFLSKWIDLNSLHKQSSFHGLHS